ncbi:MAG: SbcC/MukB-like Walker B domain-containing protein [Fusobacteriaceae bacterium]
MEKKRKDRWQINKLGIVNFWYYDYEEIPLHNGKLLLRGGNGSGKSVTLQSFIPLLLDGNRAPGRLDPFGTISRKLDNYMLVREGETERTAYLFMELKKSGIENYITVGMGIKAQKDKNTDIWYFIVRDGKRIGQDIKLKRKELGEEIVLQKKQMKNIMEESGYFFQSQREYMTAMNDIFFGFDSVEYYEDLLSLIINIRSPKLSKDFKPTKMYEILNDSLKTLDKDDLKGITEAMEEMDIIKNKIEDSKNAQILAREIGVIFQEYNKINLFNKKKNQDEKSVELDKNLNKFQALEDEMLDIERKLEEFQEEKNYLEIEKQRIEERKELLKKEDNFSKYEERFNKKNEKLNDKKHLLNSKIHLCSKEQEIFKSVQEKEQNILSELTVELRNLKISELYTPEQLKINLEKFKQLLKNVRKDIEKYEILKNTFKNLEVKLEENELKIESEKKESLRLENLLVEIVEDYKEKIIQWQDKCEVLKFSNKEIIQINELLNVSMVQGEIEKLRIYMNEIYYNHERSIKLRLERLTLNNSREKTIERLEKKEIPFKELHTLTGLDIILVSEKYKSDALDFRGKEYGNFLFSEELFQKNNDGYYKIGPLSGKTNSEEEKFSKLQLEELLKQLENENKTIPTFENLETGKETLEEFEKKLSYLESKKEEIRDNLTTLNKEIEKLDVKLFSILKDTPIEKTVESLSDLGESRETAFSFVVELISLQKEKEISTSIINNLNENIDSLEEEIEELYDEIKIENKNINLKKSTLETFLEFFKEIDIESIQNELRILNEKSLNLPTQLEKCCIQLGKLESTKENTIKLKEYNETIIKENKFKLEESRKFYKEELSLGYITEIEIQDFKHEGVSSKKLQISLSEIISKHSNALSSYKIKSKLLFSDSEDSERVDYIFTANRNEEPLFNLELYLENQIQELELLITEGDRKIFEEILLENLSQKVLAIIYNSQKWIKQINELMNNMESSSSLKLDLKWEPKKSESEEELSTVELLQLLNGKGRLTENEKKKFSNHFLHKIKKVINRSQKNEENTNYYNIISEVLDFRKWYEFRLFYVKRNEKRREMTNNNFYQLSGGEKAISMYLPLLAALYVRYEYASERAPRIVAMDEAFAGVDEKNIGMLFSHLENLDLDYILNSQILWGDYETVPELAICEILRDENDDNIALINYKWNGKKMENNTYV